MAIQYYYVILTNLTENRNVSAATRVLLFPLFMTFNTKIQGKPFLCRCKKFKYIPFWQCKCAWIISRNLHAN